MSRSRFSDKLLWDHFIKIFAGSVYSMANQDDEFLTEYLEPNFAKKVLEKSQHLLKNGYKVLFF